ncbi:carboxylesterase [Ligilactobacillus salitolerans]|uniref:Carboxylesterase n=1 Tax=Ligilactobacillus salitolerans TaxID=1808352 RepID=A0A401ITG3_9LACO|nr:hypothetical protein [Ligilactobacillus salitolerans]GBG94809.1 carboxylesterase [Ligilactobacillus salitolerans]
MEYLYRLNYPAEWKQNTPITIALHGMGTDYHDLQPVLDQIAPDAIQLSLQGDLPFQTGYEFFAPDFERGSQQEEAVIGKVIDHVYDFISHLLDDKQLTGHPLHYLGFSQGAIIGSGLVIAHPELFTQVELFSGRLPAFVEMKSKQLPKKLELPQIFISQGALDPLFEPALGKHLAAVFQEHFTNVHYHEYQVGHGIVAQTLKDVLHENQPH